MSGVGEAYRNFAAGWVLGHRRPTFTRWRLEQVQEQGGKLIAAVITHYTVGSALPIAQQTCVNAFPWYSF
jgi:hypothetical protein